MACCDDILQNSPVNAVLLTSVEAHFHLWLANKQNFSDPRKLHKSCLHSERVSVWCVVAKFSLLDNSITVTSDRYAEMLLKIVEPINFGM